MISKVTAAISKYIAPIASATTKEVKPNSTNAQASPDHNPNQQEHQQNNDNKHDGNTKQSEYNNSPLSTGLSSGSPDSQTKAPNTPAPPPSPSVTSTFLQIVSLFAGKKNPIAKLLGNNQYQNTSGRQTRTSKKGAMLDDSV